MTRQSPPIVPERGPGHCDDDAAWAEFVSQYNGQPRSRPDMTDFALANRVFMADRGDLDLIVWQTAAKERIRWLSIELAKALSAAPAREPEGGVVLATEDVPVWSDGIVTDGERVALAQKAEADHGGTYWAVDGGDGGLDWEPTHFIALAALTPKEAPAALCEHGHTDPMALCSDCEADSVEAPAATGAGEPMTGREVLSWIDACNHEPARQVLRDYLSIRAQPQAREEAQPYGWVYERLDFGPEWCAGLEWYPAQFTKKPPTPDRSRNVIALYTAPPTQPLAEGADAEKLRLALTRIAFSHVSDAKSIARAALQQEGR